MRNAFGLVFLVSWALAGCGGSKSADKNLVSCDGGVSVDAAGWVFGMSNQSDANKVTAFARSADGMLHACGESDTHGLGHGAGIGSQGALTLSSDHRFLFVVNYASNDISSFAVGAKGLTWIGVYSSQGTGPISVTASKTNLYVLNRDSAGVASYFIETNGALTPLAAGVQALNGAGTNPSDIQLSGDENSVFVAERTTSKISTFVRAATGALAAPVEVVSEGPEPFAMTPVSNFLLVAEAGNHANAASSASSYLVGAGATLTPVSSHVADFQTAACWIVATPDNKFAYVTNTPDKSVSGYVIKSDGTLTLIAGSLAGQTLFIGDAAFLDMAVSSDSKFLYVLSGGQVLAASVQTDGTLAALTGFTATLTNASSGLVGF